VSAFSPMRRVISNRMRCTRLALHPAAHQFIVLLDGSSGSTKTVWAADWRRGQLLARAVFARLSRDDEAFAGNVIVRPERAASARRRR